MSDRDIRRIWWEYAIEITDEVALRSVDPGILHSEDGDVMGVLEWNKNEQLASVLTQLLTQALTRPDLGVTPFGGGWVQIRVPEADGS